MLPPIHRRADLGAKYQVECMKTPDCCVSSKLETGRDGARQRELRSEQPRARRCLRELRLACPLEFRHTGRPPTVARGAERKKKREESRSCRRKHEARLMIGFLPVQGQNRTKQRVDFDVPLRRELSGQALLDGVKLEVQESSRCADGAKCNFVVGKSRGFVGYIHPWRGHELQVTVGLRNNVKSFGKLSRLRRRVERVGIVRSLQSQHTEQNARRRHIQASCNAQGASWHDAAGLEKNTHSTSNTPRLSTNKHEARALTAHTVESS
ncbi:hypothetical protein MRB53_040870 [Persea americana]|nr:hypothetical protein MRB53_040870 [Persea americana]